QSRPDIFVDRTPDNKTEKQSSPLRRLRSWPYPTTTGDETTWGGGMATAPPAHNQR
uniref:Uncharacterized protein n=1 Tax=Aegilops tauschii subsp. strangulata TaxID=200361 RepID=A0A453IHA1_AEGTS